MTYDGERADGGGGGGGGGGGAQLLDQLETILRHVADELAGWRQRALKAEADLKDRGGGTSAAARLDPEIRNRVADLEQENKVLRQRVEAARGRVHDLLSRLTFLEEQARQSGNGGGTGGGGMGGGGGAGTGTGSSAAAGAS